VNCLLIQHDKLTHSDGQSVSFVLRSVIETLSDQEKLFFCLEVGVVVKEFLIILNNTVHIYF